MVGEHNEAHDAEAPDERVLQRGGVLVLVGDHGGVAGRVGTRDGWLSLQQPPEQRPQIIEHQSAMTLLDLDGGRGAPPAGPTAGCGGR